METREGNLSDLDGSSEVLGAAFSDYPWTRWTVDSDDHQYRVTQLQRAALEHIGFVFGKVWLTTAGGVIHSVAIWFDSAVAIEPSALHMFDAVTAELEGSRHEVSVSAERVLQGWRPKERHFFLATVGTTPEMQGQGLGRRTLRPGLRLADSEGVDAFLETSTQANVAFYSSLGFEVVGHRRIDEGGPDVWALLRRPSHDRAPQQ